MDENTLRALIEKYKQEMITLARAKAPASVTEQEPVQLEPVSVPVATMVEETQPLEQTDNDSLQAEDVKSYAAYLQENNKQGILRIQAFAARQAIPVAGANVEVSKIIGGVRRLFYLVRTDQSGIADGMILPAPSQSLSLDPGEPNPYATYDVKITHPLYQQEEFLQVPIFDGIKSIQPVSLYVI